jgi:hypothetical protein
MAMTSQESFLSSPIDTGDEAEQVVRQCDTLLDKSKTTMDRLQAALREEAERHDAIAALREEAASLCGVGPRLRTMRQHAVEHGILAGRPNLSAVALRVVPDSAEEAALQTPSPPLPAEISTPDDTTGRTERGELSVKVLIRSENQQKILTALTGRPESEPLWGSEEIARALGIPKEAKQRKSLRNCLRALVTCGVLERVTHEGDHHVYYRPLMNWTFV